MGPSQSEDGVELEELLRRYRQLSRAASARREQKRKILLDNQLTVNVEMKSLRSQYRLEIKGKRVITSRTRAAVS